MGNQVGARWLKNQKARVRSTKLVVLNSIKRESELIRLKSGAVKRVKRMCD